MIHLHGGRDERDDAVFAIAPIAQLDQAAHFALVVVFAQDVSPQTVPAQREESGQRRLQRARMPREGQFGVQRSALVLDLRDQSQIAEIESANHSDA